MYTKINILFWMQVPNAASRITGSTYYNWRYKPSINMAESVISHNQAFDALSGLSDEDAGAVTILRI